MNSRSPLGQEEDAYGARCPYRNPDCPKCYPPDELETLRIDAQMAIERYRTARQEGKSNERAR